MSYVDNELEAGEEIIFKINRGRKFNHYYKTISQACITFPLIAYFIWKYFSTLFVDFPQPTSVDPILVQMLVPICLSGFIYGPALALVAVAILDLTHFFADELALTNRRIIGRGQSRMYWSFPKVDLLLSEVMDIKYKVTLLEIHVDGERPIIISRLDQNKEFVEKFYELKTRKGYGIAPSRDNIPQGDDVTVHV
jgi:hypothetical protein